MKHLRIITQNCM